MTMRIRFGHPDLSMYAAGPPLAGPDTAVTVSFLGVTTLLFDDGDSAVLFDGFFTRPSLLRTFLGKLRSDRSRITDALHRAGITGLDAVVVAHSHFDHALDSAVVADITGATLVGGTSTEHIGRGGGLASSRLAVVEPDDTITMGNFSLLFIESEHSHPDRVTGSIDTDITQPARYRDFRCGAAWSILITHTPTGRTALVNSSAGFRSDMLRGKSADVAYLSVAQLVNHPSEHTDEYWEQTVGATSAHTVVVTHWDNFFRPLSAPLRPLPFAVDDLAASMAAISALADRDGVRLVVPQLWNRTDPWSGR